MTLPGRLLIEIAAAVALLVTFGWGIHHERQVGAQHERSAVNQAVLAAQEASRVEHEKKATVASVIGENLEKAVSVPVAPVRTRIVRVPVHSVCPDPVPATATTGRKPDAEAAAREAASSDLGEPIVTVGRDGDAQIAALQAYISQVCLK